MALRLRHLGDVDQRGLVLSPHLVDRGRVGLDERGVIPSAGDVDIDARPVVRTEASEHVGDRCLRGFRGDWHRDSVSVIPHRHRHRDLEHARGVDRLPEQALAGRGVADGPERDLVAIDGEPVLCILQLRVVAIELRRIGKPDQSRHPSGDVRDVRARVGHVDRALELASIVEKAGREVVAHLPAARRRVGLEAGVSVELGEERADVGHPGRPHEGLVPVVAGPPVARPERLGHRDVGDLFAVAEDAEGGVASQDLSPPDDGGSAAAVGQPVVGDDGFCGEGELRVAKRFRQLSATSPACP